MLTETEKAYLAGFFDGDGCVNISVRRRKGVSPSHYLQVIFSQCNRSFLAQWCNKVGLGSVHISGGPSNSHRQKELWHWRIHDRQAAAILTMMLPYLKIKKSQAEIGLQFMGTKGRGGRRALPEGLIRLREHYKDALQDAKHRDQESPSFMREYETIQDSQLTLELT